MKPVWRLLISLVVLGAVAAVLFWPKKPVPPPKLSTLVSFDVGAVRAITVTRPGQPQVQLTRQNGNWRMVQPYAYPADKSAVQTVLDTLGHINNPRRVGAATDPAEFGLDQPSSVELQLASGKTFDFQFGGDTPTGGDTYLRLGPNGPVEIANTAVKESALKSAFLLQDKAPIHFPAGQVTEIEASHNGKHVTFTKTSGAWPKAQENNIEALLDAFGDGQMSSMVDPTGNSASAHGLFHPATSLTLVWNGGSTQLDIGAAQDPTDDYARNSESPAVFTLSDYMVSDITALFKPESSPSAAAAPAAGPTPSAISSGGGSQVP